MRFWRAVRNIAIVSGLLVALFITGTLCFVVYMVALVLSFDGGFHLPMPGTGLAVVVWTTNILFWGWIGKNIFKIKFARSA
jgi:hypothetical protein